MNQETTHEIKHFFRLDCEVYDLHFLFRDFSIFNFAHETVVLRNAVKLFLGAKLWQQGKFSLQVVALRLNENAEFL
jgi:hypothetical protein